jgi:DNA-binding transcriptional MerR regulator
MKKLYLVKEFAKLTKATVRALHYYDQIGLLEPSERTPSGYRVYTESELLKLQQIVTLKFMGFSLEQIKDLLNRQNFEIKKSLQIQSQVLEKEVARLRQASYALQKVATLLEDEGKMDWKKIIHIIEVIQMDEKTKKTWAEEFYTEEELKEFERLGKKFSPAQIQAYQQKWAELIAEVEKNLDADPSGKIAQSLARRWKALVNECYKDHPKLKKRVAEAYQTNQIPVDQRPFRPEVMEFIQKAVKIGRKKYN